MTCSKGLRILLSYFCSAMIGGEGVEALSPAGPGPSGYAYVRDVNQLKSHLIKEWEHFHQVFIDKAIRQWRPRLRACIRAAHGGHFEHRLQLCLMFAHMHILTVTSARLLYSVHLMFCGDLTKPIINKY